MENNPLPILFDTHAHFDRFESLGSTSEMLQHARDAGVTRILAMGGSPEANRTALRVTRNHPEQLFAAIGYDRDQAPLKPSRAQLEDLLAENTVHAIGECGLDYHYEAETAPAQRRLFVDMLDVARTANRPISIHSREADADTLAILIEHQQELSLLNQPMKGILHCFTRSTSFATELINLGLYISFSGILTFKNSHELRETAQLIPADRLLIETDCPYLAPVPFRGKKNEPAYTLYTAQFLAQTRNCTLAKLAAQTTENANRLLAL